MLDTLITSQTRINLLIRFFAHSRNQGYLRGLAEEFGESSNAVRIELNRLEKAGMLISYPVRNRKIYQANKDFQLFTEIRSLVLKHLKLDKLLHEIVLKTENLKEIWIENIINQSDNCNENLLLLVGDKIDRETAMAILKENQKPSMDIQVIDTDKTAALSKFPNRLLLWTQQSI